MNTPAFNESNDIGIKPSVDRMANGWAAVLEFPNGGRQRMSSRHGTMESALSDARRCLRVRLNYPESCIRDPGPNQLVCLEANWRDSNP